MLSHSPAATATTEPIGPMPEVSAGPPVGGHLALIVVAVAAWAGSLPFADQAHLDSFGLLPRLPVTFLVAVAALCVGFALAARHRGRTSERLTLLYLAALVLVLYATIPLLYDEPRYPYVYKHIAVIHYIEVHGSVDRTIDIYQNWPGFFALNAVFSQITGIDALRYANWTQVLFPVADLLALRFLFGGLTTDRRRIHVALVLFLLGAWVEYSYLAPQSLAFFLTLVVLGIALRCLRPDPGQWHQRVLDAVSRRARALLPRVSRFAAGPAPLEAAGPPQAAPVPVGLAVVLVLAMCTVVVITHQLTPFFLGLDLTLLVLARRCRAWWLPLAVGLLALAWIGLAYDYLAAHFPTLLGGNPFENAQPTNNPHPGPNSAGVRFIANVARLLTLVMVLLALAGAWRDHRAGRRQNVVLALAAAPVLLVLAQSYGGEGVYRIYMFMMPWLAYLAAGLFAGAGARLGRGRTGILAVTTVTCGTLFLTAYYGLEHSNRIQPQEVAATAWFDANAPGGSPLVLMIANHPYPLSGNYDEHLALYGHYAGEVLTDPAWTSRRLTSADVPKLRDLVLANGPNSYLLLSPSQVAYAEDYGYAPAGSLMPFQARVIASEYFQVVFVQEDSYVLRPVK